jgi:hypothetical protein
VYCDYGPGLFGKFTPRADEVIGQKFEARCVTIFMRVIESAWQLALVRRPRKGELFSATGFSLWSPVAVLADTMRGAVTYKHETCFVIRRNIYS